ncbi:MAG: response regulator transcription factor, partial [Sphingomonadales bacterium]
MRVLIVEDEPNLRNQLQATLEGAGYAVARRIDGIARALKRRLKLVA